MNRYDMMKKIAKTNNCPQKIQVANARGRSLYEIYSFVRGNYCYSYKKWNEKEKDIMTVTEAYKKYCLA